MFFTLFFFPSIPDTHKRGIGVEDRSGGFEHAQKVWRDHLFFFFGAFLAWQKRPVTGRKRGM